MNTDTVWQEKISFFIELGKPLSKAKTLKETVAVIMYQVGKVFQPVNWSLLLKDSKSDNLIFSAVVGKNKAKLQGRSLPKGEGIAGHIFSTGEPLIVQEVDKDKRFSDRVDKYTGFKTDSIIGVPLKTKASVFGVIELVNKIGGDSFQEVDLKVLLAIAEYAAIAIERSYYYQALQKMAFYDSLTGLKNKNHFNYTLNDQVDLFDRYKTPSAFIFINIIGFRAINEANGYKTGDQVLVNLAKILLKSVRKVDMIFRYEADRFIILMPQTRVRDAEIMKERIAANHLKFQDNLRDETPFQIKMKVQSIEAEQPKDLIKIVHNEIYGFMDIARQVYSEPMANNLQMMLTEEDPPQTEKKKTFPGKKVSLHGTFVHYANKDHGYLTIKRVSTQGVSFETKSNHAFAIDDMLNIEFTLDNAKRSKIKRQASIQTIDGNYYDAIFYNPPPYDKDLGFYMIG